MKSLKTHRLNMNTQSTTNTRKIKWADHAAPDLGLSDEENGLTTIRVYFKGESIQEGQERRFDMKNPKTPKKIFKTSAGAWVPPSVRRRMEAMQKKAEEEKPVEITIFKRSQNAWVPPSVRRRLEEQQTKEQTIG